MYNRPTSPLPPSGSLSPSLPEMEGRTYSLNNRLLVSPLPLEGDGGGFHLEGGERLLFLALIKQLILFLSREAVVAALANLVEDAVYLLLFLLLTGIIIPVAFGTAIAVATR